MYVQYMCVCVERVEGREFGNILSIKSGKRREKEKAAGVKEAKRVLKYMQKPIITWTVQ